MIDSRVSLLILNQQKEILLIKRTKNQREYWVFPGGGVEDGETLNEAANREALEETSIVLGLLEPIFSVFNMGRREHFLLSYVADVTPKLGNGPERIIQNEDNRYELHWVHVYSPLMTNLYPVEAREILVSFASESRL